MQTYWSISDNGRRRVRRQMILTNLIDAALTVFGLVAVGPWLLVGSVGLTAILFWRLRRLRARTPEATEAARAFLAGFPLERRELGVPWWGYALGWVGLPVALLRCLLGPMTFLLVVPDGLHARLVGDVLFVYDDDAIGQERALPRFIIGDGWPETIGELHRFPHHRGLVEVAAVEGEKLR